MSYNGSKKNYGAKAFRFYAPMHRVDDAGMLEVICFHCFKPYRFEFKTNQPRYHPDCARTRDLQKGAERRKRQEAAGTISSHEAKKTQKRLIKYAGAE